jgi:hypothetical protein
MIAQVKQGSAEWLKLRSNLVTATDFSSICHRAKLIKYSYAKAKIETHLNDKFKTNHYETVAMAKGKAYEPLILDKVAKLLKKEFEQYVLVAGDYMASYDALHLASNTNVEIKTCSRDRDGLLSLLDGYVCQVAHQNYVLSIEAQIAITDITSYIIVLQFVDDNRQCWHVIYIDQTTDYIRYRCKTLDIDKQLDISAEMWSSLCSEFYVEIKKRVLENELDDIFNS